MALTVRMRVIRARLFPYSNRSDSTISLGSAGGHLSSHQQEGSLVELFRYLLKLVGEYRAKKIFNVTSAKETFDDVNNDCLRENSNTATKQNCPQNSKLLSSSTSYIHKTSISNVHSFFTKMNEYPKSPKLEFT
ncbi:hypothetical protein LguiA_008765 [Lonicera macranthoides]